MLRLPDFWQQPTWPQHNIFDLPQLKTNLDLGHSGCQLDESRVAVSRGKSLSILRLSADSDATLEEELGLGYSFSYHESVCYDGAIILCGRVGCELHSRDGDGGWRRKKLPGMREPRWSFASVLVGQQLFAVGGYGGGRLKTVEVLDLGQPRAWTVAKVSLPTATWHLKATLLNNRIVVVGGDHQEGKRFSLA